MDVQIEIQRLGNGERPEMHECDGCPTCAEVLTLAVEVELHHEPSEPNVGIAGGWSVDSATCRGWPIELDAEETERAEEIAEGGRPTRRRSMDRGAWL